MLALFVTACGSSPGGDERDASRASDAALADTSTADTLDGDASAADTSTADAPEDVDDAAPDAFAPEDAAPDAGREASAEDAPSDARDGSHDDAGLDTLPAQPTYLHLGETGLYADLATRTVAADVLAFEPTHKLWSDGATKRRWIALPPGTRIDTSDMDHWVFPVGTKVWKEFSQDGVLLETRLVERFGPGADDYWMGAFAWNPEQTDAVFVAGGASNVLGTAHDVPPTKDCGACHRGDVGRVLGFSAIQLSRPPGARGPTLQDLAAGGFLTAPPPPGVDYPVPGDGPTASALGYLHANCGHCHNERGTSWPDTQMVLRLEVGERRVADTKLFKTTFDQTLQYWRGGDITLRIAAGHPEASAVFARMNRRGKDQMPSLATEVLDPSGLELVRAWIAATAAF